MESRLGLAALVLAAATWAQLVLVPLVARHPDLPTGLLALLSLAILVAAAVLRQRVQLATTLALGAYPFALGFFAFVLGRRPVPRFDATSQMVAAFTTAGFAAAVIAWSRAATPVSPLTVSLIEPANRPASPTSHAPPLQKVSQTILAGVALFCGVVAPSVLAARDPSGLDESLARGRHALVTATGLVMAVALVLGGGSALVRAAPRRERHPGRAVGYLAWAVLAYAMNQFLNTR